MSPRHAALAAVLVLSVAADARAATTTVSYPRTVSEGSRIVVKGRVQPAKTGLKATLLAGKVAVSAPKRVRSSGRFKLRTLTGYQAQSLRLRVRVVRKGRTYGRSQAFVVQVVRRDPVVTPTPTPTPTPSPSVTATPAPEALDTFRAIHAVPSDKDPGASQSAAIAHEASVVGDWFFGQAALRPRWRAAAGAVEVSVVTLPGSTADYSIDDSDGAAKLRRDIEATLPIPDREFPVIWIDAGRTPAEAGPGEGVACGARYGGLDQIVMWERSCSIYPATNTVFPSGGSYLLAHEMTHAFGAVKACAPHADGSGHVNDNRADLLYQGAEPRDWNNLTLDPGRDDYFQTGRADCPGIENSPLWATG